MVSERREGGYRLEMIVKDLFRTPVNLPLIAPSVLSADFSRLGEDCAQALREAGADLLHVDVMDGHFVPNLTMGPDTCLGLRRVLPDAFLDVHLMVTNPLQFVPAFARAGANHVTGHIEVLDEPGVRAFVAAAHDLGMSAGIAINPPTPVERVLRVVELVDMVLVMSVNPGYSGQSFIASVVEKTRTARARMKPSQRLQMDGGLSPGNAALVREAGCDVLVAGAALMAKAWADRRAVVKAMKM
jgi:ribulose-phosphate 3-epimerase